MKRFALLFCIFSLFLGSVSFGDDLLQEVEKKAEELGKRMERGRLDLASPKVKAPYYIQDSQAENTGPQKPRPLALAVKAYDGTEGTEIKVGGQQVADSQNAANAILQSLKHDAPVAADRGTLREGFNLKRDYWKITDSSSNKLSAGITPEGNKGAQVQVRWKGLGPPASSAPDSIK